jgi:hypothetical protein
MKAFRQALSELATRRKCFACKETARFMIFMSIPNHVKEGKKGKKDELIVMDKSSKLFACPEHAGNAI